MLAVPKTKKEVAMLVSKLRVRKNKLEGNGIVKTYQAFLSLPYKEQERITNEWTAYFNKVRETRAYLRYKEQSKALKAGDLARVKELATEARLQRENKEWELESPEGYDPIWMVNSAPVTEYYQVINRLKQLIGDGDMADAIEALL